jgi:hypothetical protein
VAASLTYYLWEGVLVGTANGAFFQVFASSGGGGGSTLRKTTSAANNPYMTARKTKGEPGSKGHGHGGPIPLGPYAVASPAQHPKVKLSARLTPTGGQPMWERDGFLIHGPGPHGSDGCIVVEKKPDFHALMEALRGSKGGTLYVEEAMYGMRFA